MLNKKYTVVIFGSSKSNINTNDYIEAMKLAALLAKQDMVVITGGGPGIMEAANKGAAEAGGLTGAFRCEIKNEPPNKECTPGMFFACENMHERQDRFLQCADAYVFFPGGYGTLDELFTVLVHMQINKIKKVPVILYNKEFWSGLALWLNQTVLFKNMITPEDNDFYIILDEIQEVYKAILQKTTCFY